jgi:HJR/Mrr/RecB family endonuclease
MASKIWTPAPIAVGFDTLFSGAEIEAYERDVLANANANEHDASRFFQRFPKFLHFGAGVEVRREVVLVAKKQRVDFFRRSYGESFWDIIELKHPHGPLVSGSDTLHPRLSADVDKAINQALDYRDLIDSDGDVRADLKSKGITVCRPQIIVVVGQDRGEVDPETLRVLYDRVRDRGAIDPRSYSDIYAFAKEHYARTKMVIVPSLHFADQPMQFPDAAIKELVDLLATDPAAVYRMTPGHFEQTIAHILESFGFAIELTARTSDNGADIIAVRDGVGTSKFLIECKRYSQDRKIGVDVVRAIHGSVVAAQATKGMIVTTGTFTRGAKDYLDRNRWLLEGVDYHKLVEWILEYRKRERGDLL